MALPTQAPHTTMAITIMAPDTLVILFTPIPIYQQPAVLPCKSDLQLDHAFLAQHTPELKVATQDVQVTHAPHGKLLPPTELVAGFLHTLALPILEAMPDHLIQETPTRGIIPAKDIILEIQVLHIQLQEITTTKHLAMPDKEDRLMELTVLTAQPTQELQTITQAALQIHVLGTDPSFYLMAPAVPARAQKSQTTKGEVALCQGQCTDMQEATTTQQSRKQLDRQPHMHQPTLECLKTRPQSLLILRMLLS